MEKLPQLKVIGSQSESDKSKVNEDVLEIRERQVEMLPPESRKRKTLEAGEFPKTKEQLEILEWINNRTNQLLIESGVQPFDIPAQNYHILSEVEFKEFTGSSLDSFKGMFIPNSQAIAISYKLRNDLLHFAYVAAHEALHMKSIYVIEAWKDYDGKSGTKTHRSGLRSYSSHRTNIFGDGPHVHLSGVDEAVISWQEKIIFKELLQLPLFEKEKAIYESSKMKDARSQIASKYVVSEDDIYKIDNVEKGVWSGVGYGPQRKVLEYVCEEIKNAFPWNYKNKEDVFKLFIKATFDGKVLEIGRLMKETFGEDGFRILAMLTNDDSHTDANSVLEMLKKSRRRIEGQSKK